MCVCVCVLVCVCACVGVCFVRVCVRVRVCVCMYLELSDDMLSRFLAQFRVWEQCTFIGRHFLKLLPGVPVLVKGSS